MKTAPLLIRLPDLNPPLDDEVSPPVETMLDSMVTTPSDEAMADDSKDDKVDNNHQQDQVETIPVTERRQRRRQQRREPVKSTNTWKTLAWQVTVGGLLVALFLIAYVLIVGGRSQNNSAENDESKGLNINKGQRVEPYIENIDTNNQSLPNGNDPPHLPHPNDGSTQPKQDFKGPDFTYEDPLNSSRPGDGSVGNNNINEDKTKLSFPHTVPSNSYTYPVTDPNKHKYPDSMSPDFDPVTRTGRRNPDPNDGANRRPSRDGRTRTAYLPGQIEELQHGGNQR